MSLRSSHLALGAVADDEEAVIAHAVLAHGSLQIGQEADILLRAEPAHIPQTEDAVVAAALVRRKQERIYAAAHRKDGPPGVCEQQACLLDVGCEDDAGQAVEANAGPEDVFFGGGGNLAGQWSRERASPLRQTPLGKFVQIGVPGGHQGQPQGMRNARAGDAHVAGAGDVHDLGAEFANALQHPGKVALEQEVKTQVPIQVESQRAARQFQYFEIAVVRVQLAGTGMDRKKGQSLSARRGHDVAARRGHAVDSVIGVGEEGNPRPPAQTAPRSPRPARRPAVRSGALASRPTTFKHGSIQRGAPLFHRPESGLSRPLSSSTKTREVQRRFASRWGCSRAASQAVSR